MNYGSEGQSATTVVVIIVVIAAIAGGYYYMNMGEEEGGENIVEKEPTNPYIGSGKLDGEGIPPDFFSDLDVRKAFTYSFDFQTYIDDAFLGQGKKAPGPVPTEMRYFNDDQEMYSYDLEKAEEHFKKAYGGSVDDPGPVWENGFEMTVVYNEGNPQRRVACEIWKESIEEINDDFNVNVQGSKWSSVLNDMVVGRLPIFIIGWLPDFPDPHNFVTPFMHSTGTFSQWQGYGKDEVDNLIDQGISTLDEDERRDTYYELQEIYHEDLPSFPLCEPTSKRYHRESVEGWYHNPLFASVIYAYPYSKTSDSGNPNEFIIQESGEPETLDPAWAYDTASSEPIINVYEPLIFYEGSTIDEFESRLATEWEQVDDTTYRFKIREGVEFHNGNSLTPSDVEYSLERLMVMDRDGGPSWMLLEPLLGVHGTRNADGEINVDFSEIDDSVEVVDDDWVQLNLESPYPPFLDILARSWAMVIDQEWAAEQGAWPGTEETWENYNNPDTAPLQENMNGTGPFKFDRWEKGSQTVLSQFDDYWRDTANFDRVKIQYVSEWSTRKQAFLQGDADIAYVPRANSEEVIGEEGIVVHENLPSLQTNPAAFYTFDIKTEWE